MATKCLKRTRTADDSVFLSFYSVPVQGGLEPTDIGPVHEYPNKPLDPAIPAGTGGFTPGVTPTQEAPVQETPVTDPGTTQPSTPASEPIDPWISQYSDPAVEMDYYTIGCANLNYIISYINNKLASYTNSFSPKVETLIAYYQNKLSKATTAFQSLKCDVPDVVNINNPTTITDPQVTTPAESPTTPATSETPVTEKSAVPVIPISQFTPQPAPGGGGGGGGGGGDETAPTGKKPVPKKTNWWLLAGCVATVALSVYQSRNLEM